MIQIGLIIVLVLLHYSINCCCCCCCCFFVPIERAKREDRTRKDKLRSKLGFKQSPQVYKKKEHMEILLISEECLIWEALSRIFLFMVILVLLLLCFTMLFDTKSSRSFKKPAVC